MFMMKPEHAIGDGTDLHNLATWGPPKMAWWVAATCYDEVTRILGERSSLEAAPFHLLALAD